MKKYIVIYYAPKELMDQMKDITPEQQEEGMKAWYDWAKGCGEGMVDLGAPLCKGFRVTSEGSTESEREVSGYSILQAEDMEGAKAMLKDHPHLSWGKGCAVEVYETMPMPG